MGLQAPLSFLLDFLSAGPAPPSVLLSFRLRPSNVNKVISLGQTMSLVNLLNTDMWNSNIDTG